MRLAEPSDFLQATGIAKTFCQQLGFDKSKLVGILAQLEDTFARIRRVAVEPSTVTIARHADGVSVDWTTSNLRLPKAEQRPGAKATETKTLPASHSRVRGMGFRWSDEPALQALHLERPHPRETMCGDMAMVARRGSMMRLAVADGLGHGPAAREAAQVAIRWLQSTQNESLEEAVLTAHEQTAATRGATLGIVDLDLKTQIITATTIGNIRVGIYQSAGRVWSPCGTDAVLGHGRGSFHGKLDVRVEKYQLPPGALVLLFSDGLANHLRLPFQRPQSLEELGTSLFATYVVPSDDATLLMLTASR